MGIFNFPIFYLFLLTFYSFNYSIFLKLSLSLSCNITNLIRSFIIKKIIEDEKFMPYLQANITPEKLKKLKDAGEANVHRACHHIYKFIKNN